MIKEIVQCIENLKKENESVQEDIIALMEIVEIYYSNNRDNLVSIYEFVKNSTFTYGDILYIKKN